MKFSQHFNVVEQNIQNSVKKIITDNYTSLDAFRLWLKHEAEEEIGYIYVKHFKKEFRQYINEDNQKQLYYGGKNLIYGLMGFIGFMIDLSAVLIFVENFIAEQLDQFEKDYNIDWVDEDGDMKPLGENPT